MEYNSLAPAQASCMEDGHSLTKMCEDGVPRSELEGRITDLHEKWEKLDILFADLNKKLTAALIQVFIYIYIYVYRQRMVGKVNGLGVSDLGTLIFHCWCALPISCGMCVYVFVCVNACNGVHSGRNSGQM